MEEELFAANNEPVGFSKVFVSPGLKG